MADTKKSSSSKLNLESVQELLKVQENSFTSLIKSLMNDFNSRLDAFAVEIGEIKRSLEFTQKEFDDLKCHNRIMVHLNSS